MTGFAASSSNVSVSAAVVPSSISTSPEMCNNAPGLAVPIPTRLFAASMDRVLESKLMPSVPPERVTAKSLATVRVPAWKVMVSPEASPKVVFPLTVRVPVMV